MNNPQILELARACRFDTFAGEKDDGTSCDYWECWEDQLLKFALLVHENGYEQGYNDGCFQAIGGQS